MSLRTARSRRSDASLVGTAAACAVFLVAWGLIHRGFWAHDVISDTPTYQRYGDAIVHGGRVPYRDFRLEYPPGALPVFALPSLHGTYNVVFGWLMAALGVTLVAVVSLRRALAGWFVAVSPVLVGSLLLTRFDLWPALLATSAVVALGFRRERLGSGLLGAAVAAKLWPLVLVPAALVLLARRGRLHAAWPGAAVLALAFLPFAAIAPHGLWASLSGQASRPLQIESVGAAVITTFGHPQVITSHGSQNLAGYGAVGAALSVLQIATIVALWVGYARGEQTPERFARFAAASVCAFIALGKVLSPQFLVWLVPLVPLVRGLRGAVSTALLTAALVLTQVWFPARYWEYADGFRFAGVVLARDLVLVALLAVLALPARRRTSGVEPS